MWEHLQDKWSDRQTDGEGVWVDPNETRLDKCSWKCDEWWVHWNRARLMHCSSDLYKKIGRHNGGTIKEKIWKEPNNRGSKYSPGIKTPPAVERWPCWASVHFNELIIHWRHGLWVSYLFSTSLWSCKIRGFINVPMAPTVQLEAFISLIMITTCKWSNMTGSFVASVW